MPVNYKLYPTNWKEISRRIRFERAKGFCESCGVPHMAINPYTGRKIVLACIHLDGNRSNNKERNLAAYCQRCHILHDRRQHVYSRRYGREVRYQTGTLFVINRVRAKLIKRPRSFRAISMFENPQGIKQALLFQYAPDEDRRSGETNSYLT